MFTTEPGRIDLGPVTLLSNRNALYELTREIRSYYGDRNSPDASQWNKDHVKRAIGYYRNFKWVAKVTVSNCDLETSEETSQETLVSAIDCLHFVLGRKQSYRMRVAESAVSYDSKALAYLDASNNLHVSTSNGSLDLMGFSEGWSKDLARADIAEMLDLIGLALQSRADRSLNHPLSERFLDAARWFGEGVRDSAAFSKTVKFITAVERLVVAGKTDNLTETVSTRVADMTLESDAPEAWESYRKRVSKAYGLRSDLVHGSVSPFAERVLSEVSQAGEISENLLVSMLFRLGRQGLLETDVSDHDYAEWFDRIRQYVKDIHSRYSEELIERQISTAREVMKKREKALRELAK